MFANANATNKQTDSDRTLTNESVNASRSASPAHLSSTRRNLFGIRLNHDQLAQDLKDMWQESIDRQTQNWGFDFQKLKPIEAVDKKQKKTDPKVNQRFEWSKVSTKMNKFYNDTEVKPATFDKQELLSSDYETEEEEEEEDDALVIPTFYKYQRRQKLNETQNRLKLINQLSAGKSKATAFSKMNNSGAASANKKMHRPSARKATQVPDTKQKITTRTPKRLANKSIGNKSLILTFSENRKDTLRSAAGTTTTTTVTMATSSKTAAKNLSDMFEKSVAELEHSSAFKQPLKQQSLLDMLKQRKRKTTAIDGKAKTSAIHNLRPRATSFTAN